jgi:N-acetylglucosaminyldiphosphoundecaprenol N-acetyl-beta-D-mannosaminyltransferase
MGAGMYMQHVVLGVRVDDISSEDLTAKLTSWLAGEQAKIVVTPNPEFVMYAKRDPDFRKLLQEADLALPDGVGLRFAVAALSDETLKHRHTGADTLVELAGLCAREHKKLVLLGGSPRKAQRAAVSLRERFPGLDVATFDPGIIDEHHVRLSEATLTGVERLSPQVVAVALGQGKQEKVMDILKHKIPSIRILIGVGGASDYVAMAVRRAPKSWQRYGFEWLWRLIQEPWRWQRILNATFFFPLRVAWATIVSGRFFKAVRHVSQELKRHFQNV